MIRSLVIWHVVKTSLDRSRKVLNLFFMIRVRIFGVFARFFEFEEVFLGMRADLGAVSSLDDFLDFFPIFAVEFEA